MFGDMENLKIIAIHKGVLKRRNASGICRDYHAFILRLSGCVRYTFCEKNLELCAGEILFVPMGTEYSYRAVSDEPCEYISVRFTAEHLDTAAKKYSFDGFQRSDEYINGLSELWKFGGNAEHYRCYSIFYELLAYLENLENLSYIDKKKSNIISPALAYLKKHIYDSDLKVETLIGLCGISGTYFDKIFRANYGTSPQKYISAKRLSHAKTLIDSGDFETIAEVAASAGFSDPLYFSRVFRKKYGISPSEYSKG